MRKLLKMAAATSSTVVTMLLAATPAAAQYTYDYSYDTAVDDGFGAMFTGLGLLCQIPMCLIGLASFGFWVWMFIDVLKRDEKVLPGKIKWILLMVFAGTIGSIVYYFMRKRKMDAAGSPAPAQPAQE